MTKQEAINLLGGAVAHAAELIGVTPSAISQWPDDLPPRIVDRVQAALWRKANNVPTPKRSTANEAAR